MDDRPLAANSEDPEILMELAIIRSLDCATPRGRETPVPNYKLQQDEFPYINNDASPPVSPGPMDVTKEEPMSIDTDQSEPPQISTHIKTEIKDETRDIRTMESSAAEALITLAGQDNIIRFEFLV